MLEHPWIELQLLIKEKWLTQKAFASILWKKVSEVNELLKWKRNITIQRDYLLHQTLWTPVKYWILKQIDYDYSLLDIEETSDSSVDKDGLEENLWNLSESLDGESSKNWTSYESSLTEGDLWEAWNQVDSSSLLLSEWQTITQKKQIEDLKNKDDEDLKNRAKIFRTF